MLCKRNFQQQKNVLFFARTNVWRRPFCRKRVEKQEKIVFAEAISRRVVSDRFRRIKHDQKGELGRKKKAQLNFDHVNRPTKEVKPL